MYPKSSLPIDISYVDYNHKPMELFGALVTDISSLGWKVKSAKFLISENRTRCLLDLDLQDATGVKTTQSSQQEVFEIMENNLAETSTHWREFYSSKYKDIFT